MAGIFDTGIFDTGIFDHFVAPGPGGTLIADYLEYETFTFTYEFLSPIVSVLAGEVNAGVSVSYAGTLLTITGKYENIFAGGSKFRFVREDYSEGIEVSTNLPASFLALVEYYPGTADPEIFTYSVTLQDASQYLVEHTIFKNWDSGKEALRSAITRGRV